VTRRDNASHRCLRCRMLNGLCVCSLIPEPKLETRTRVVLFIHRYEDRKPTNTGRLATECLSNSEVIVRGHESGPTERFEAPPNTLPLLLFPHPEAVPLRSFEASERPITLVVPDGSWRQASKVQTRVPGIRELQRVWLPLEAMSQYRLRHEAHDTGLATIEAIARAMDILEGPHVRLALERVFKAMVDRTLWSRGRIGKADAQDTIPEGLARHDLLDRRD
jgi:DTW domain-containing protein